MPKYTKERLIKIIPECFSFSEVLRKLELSGGGNHKTLKKYCKKWNIDTSHFLTHSERNKKMWKNGKFKKATPLKEILVENSTYKRVHLKRRIISAGLLKKVCYICNIEPEWNGKPLTLQLDHINGIPNDNRLENLRLLCPNCHSQTKTFAGRKNAKPKNKCIDCKKEIGKRSKRCSNCANKENSFPNFKRANKITWPPNEELAKLVWEYPRSTLAKQLGVSDVAISKRCKKHNIPQPPRGYWAKVYSNKI